jgi:hypothetical protein
MNCTMMHGSTKIKNQQYHFFHLHNSSCVVEFFEMRMMVLDLETRIWLIKLDIPFERAAAIVVSLRKKSSSLLKLSYFSCNPIRKEYKTSMTYRLHLIMLIVVVKWFVVFVSPKCYC